MARIKLKDRTLENDIKYGGFLSYRHLRIIAWILLAIVQISTILSLQAKLNKSSQETVEIFTTILSFVSGLPLPLFFLANFSNMARKRENFKSMFMLYGGAAIGMYLFCNFLVLYYGHGLLSAFEPGNTRSNTLLIFGEILPQLNSGYNLNMFIDLFLFTLLFFFIFYRPKKVFTGKKIVFFRLFALIPILYDLGAIFVKYYLYQGYFQLKSQYFFLLPCKPPLVFGAFVIVLLVLKFDEYRYIKRHNNSLEAWEIHSSTNAHSLRMSIKMAVIFFIFAIVDLVILVVFFGKITYDAASIYQTPEDALLFVVIKLGAVTSAGIGVGASLIFLVPIVMLYSYSKTHNNPKIDVVIPAAGVALIIFVYVEGLYEVLTRNIAEVMKRLADEESQQTLAFFTGNYRTYNLFSISRYIPGNFLSFASRC